LRTKDEFLALRKEVGRRMKAKVYL